jgi:tRNA(adenine34) deaminase
VTTTKTTPTEGFAPFMQQALALADEAARLGEVPVGAVVVVDGAIVGAAYNQRETDNDPVAHAEILAMQRASKALGRWRLHGATLVVTLEPCFMCAGALVNARVDRLIYAAADPRAGAVSTLATVCTDVRLNHRLVVDSGLFADESARMLQTFFRARRHNRS